MPPRIHTILHSGFVLRQPPPHHIHASDFSQARWYPDQPRNFSALRRYVGRIRSSLQSRCQPINKLLRPAAFVQRTGKTTSAGLRSVRLRGKRSRLWCRQQDSNLRTRKFFISELYPPSFCLHIAPSGRSRSPAHQERRGKRKRMEMQSLPLHPHVITSFFVVAFRCATSPNFCVYIRRILFFYRTFFQRAVTAVFSKGALAPFCSGYTARYSGCAYSKMPRNRAHAPAALKV